MAHAQSTPKLANPSEATPAPRPNAHSRAAAARRLQIIEAAIFVIAHEGLPATTIERVALRADLSPGTVMGHFGSKEQLLAVTLRTIAEEFEAERRKAIAAAGDDAMAALHGLIEATFSPAVSRPDKVAVWYAFWGDTQARRTYLEQTNGMDSAYFADVLRLFRSLSASHTGPVMDAEAAAAGFAGLLEWQWQTLLVEGRRFDRRRAVRLCRAYLHGVFQRGDT